MILKIIFTLLNGMISVLPLNNSVTRNCSADSVFIMYLFRCVFLVADKRLIGSSRFFFRINCRLITKLLILLCSFSLYSPRSVLSPQHISFPSLHALIRWPGLCIPCAIPRYHQREHPTRRLCHIAHPRSVQESCQLTDCVISLIHSYGAIHLYGAHQEWGEGSTGNVIHPGLEFGPCKRPFSVISVG